MAQTSSGSKGTPFLDDQRVTKRTKEHNHTTTNLQNQSQTSISIARNKGKNHDETKQVQHSNAVMIDRISSLPHSIILHILSLLPTAEVIRTSLISKRWRHLWESVPALEFCDVGVEEQELCNFLNKCLEHRMIGKRRLNDLGINRFKLEMQSYGGSSSVHVDRWLSFAVQQHLEELDLHIEPKKLGSLSFFYRIPSFYYCIPSLTVLKLSRLRLDDEVFHNLIMGCPSLEKLFLRNCFGLHHLKVSSSNLKSFELISLDRVNSCLVEAVNLQSLVFNLCGYDSQLDLVSCKSVRNLKLNYAHPSHIPSLEVVISELRILESLTLVDFDIDIIQNQYLKVLVLKRTTIEDDEDDDDEDDEDEDDEDDEDDDEDEWDDKMEITVNTPSLVSFHYEDVNFTRKVLLNSPNLEEANIKLDYNGVRKKIDMNWYVDMIDFLSYFDCSKVVNLYVYSEENLMFPKKLRKFCRSPLPNVKHLKVETRCELKSESLLRDALLWLSPQTQTLSIRSEENKAQS